MSRPRDIQQTEVYRAGSWFIWNRVDEGGDFIREKDIKFWEDYLNRKLVQSKWFKKTFDLHHEFKFDITDGRGTNCPFGITYGGNGKKIFGGRINLPRWSRNEIFVLHEVAHVVCSPNFAYHGPEFCRIFLKLIRHYLGREAERDLKKSFDKFKVKWKNKKVLSPERLQQLRERGRILVAPLKENKE